MGLGRPLYSKEDRKMLDAKYYKPAIEQLKSFVARGKWVFHGTRWIASAVSRTMAQRMANALNQYDPNDRGY